jgi:hypothetical protein
MEVDEEMKKVLYNHFSVGKPLAIAVHTGEPPNPLLSTLPQSSSALSCYIYCWHRRHCSNAHSSRACHRFISQGPGSEAEN